MGSPFIPFSPRTSYSQMKTPIAIKAMDNSITGQAMPARKLRRTFSRF